MAGIYIHIPFCRQACYYCDFHFSTSPQFVDEVVSAIAEELRIRRGYLGTQTVGTIYLGGGTPSLLKEVHLNGILDTVHQNFKVSSQPEITIEANPDDLSIKYLHMLAESGINRLSVGVQSFDNGVLKWMNRIHSQKQAQKSILNAREAGFDNLSMDLIYGIPLDRDLQKELEIALQLQPSHLSTYCLTIEPKTVFGHRVNKGLMSPVDEDKAASEFEFLIDTLPHHGYEHYEISNFSLPGMASRHNSNYWKQEHYLGVGPSAHSYNGVSRQYNQAHNSKYLAGMKAHKPPIEIEYLSSSHKANELIMTSLRTSEGLDLEELETIAGKEELQKNLDYIESLKLDGFAQVNKNKLILTTKGKLIADRIASDMFLDN